MPLTPEQERHKKNLERQILTKPTAEKYLEIANLYYADGNGEKAIAYYQEYIKIKPNDAAAHNNLGVFLYNMGRLEEAEKCYHQAINLKPDFAETHYNLGLLLYKLGRLEEAEKCYHQAIDLKPDYVEAHGNLGVLLADMGRLEEAEKCYHQAINLKPDLVESHGNLGVLLADMGRLEEAEKCYHQAIDIDPNDAAAHSNLGNLLSKLGRLEEAEKCHRQAIDLRPAFVESHNNLGSLLSKLGRLEEAEKCYRQAIDLRPDLALPHNNLGFLLADMGRLEEAEEHLLTAIKLEPRQYNAYYTFFILYRSKGDMAKAVEYYRQAVEIEPQLRDESFELENKIERTPETLVLHNFGLITELSISLKPLTVFIGQSGAGKSTLAKLLAILGHLKQYWNGKPNRDDLDKEFLSKLSSYGIAEYLRDSTYFKWQQGVCWFEYQNGRLSAGQPVHFERPTVYIPAERAFTAIAMPAMFNLIANKAPLPDILTDFGAKFEQARTRFRQLDIPMLGISYEYKNGEDYIVSGGGHPILLRQSASSHLSLAPMYLIMQYCRDSYPQNLFVIEEPELNLFPSLQDEFTAHIIANCLYARPSNQVIITTHSPYVLTSLNCLIQAFSTFRTQPQEVEQIKQIVPFEQWLRYNDVAAYYLEKGSAKDIMNSDYQLILDGAIDAASEYINERQSQLLDIKYQEQSNEKN